MSVTIAKAVVAGLRAYGVVVIESDGAYSRGNGQTSKYMGLTVHHTGGDYGHDYPTLYKGRPDLKGPLCNTSGNADGSITLVAAHPANHAGASGGWDTAPLPVTGLFNQLMWGHEIVYPGVSPMRDAQYRSALILARVVSEVLKVPMSHIKTHQGTSITGKWDPGFAQDKTIDIAAFRRDAAALKGGAPVDGSEDAMLILNANDKWPPKGPGPFGATRVAYQSGGTFAWMDPTGHKVVVEDGVNNRHVPAMWVNNETWDSLDMQSKQIRDVLADGVTRRPAPPPAKARDVAPADGADGRAAPAPAAPLA